MIGHAKHVGDDVKNDAAQQAWDRTRLVMSMMHVQHGDRAERRHSGQVHHPVNVHTCNQRDHALDCIDLGGGASDDD